VKFWVCLLELWQIRLNRSALYRRVRRYLRGQWTYRTYQLEVWQTRFGRRKKVVRKPWQGYWWYQLEVWQTRFGRLGIGPRKPYTAITWWTYWVAVRRTLKVARLCKSMWARSDLDVHTCLWAYERYAKVQQRALSKGYTRLASESIHDKWR
jgi:hypothetical protein